MNREYYEDVDALNYYAIEYLETLGNEAPTEQQISTMERMLEFCGLVSDSNLTAAFLINNNEI